MTSSALLTLSSLIFCGFSFETSSPQTVQSPIIDQIDWNSFLARHDPIWSWNSSHPTQPLFWEDGAFYGNGLLGGMILVDSEDNNHTIRFQIGRTDVFDHQDLEPLSAKENIMFSRPRLPIGSLGLTTKGEIMSGLQRNTIQLYFVSYAYLISLHKTIPSTYPVQDIYNMFVMDDR